MKRLLNSTALVVAISAAGSAFAGTSPIATQFEGVSLRDYIVASGGFATTPPDMAGAVSASHVIQFTNGGVGVYTKGGTQLSYQTTSDFLRAAGVPIADDDGDPFDPRLTYDPATKRFYGVFENRGPAGNAAPATGRDFPKLGADGEAEHDSGATRVGANGEINAIDAPTPFPNNPIYVLVSNDSDPTHGFKAVAFNTTQGYFGDFPTLGVSNNAITITTNDFDANSLQSVSVFTLPKRDLLKATPTTANLTRLEGVDPAALGFAVQAVNKTSGYNLTGVRGLQTQKLIGISAVNGFEVNAADLVHDRNGRLVGGAIEGAIPIAFDGDTRGSRQPLDVAALRAFDPFDRPHPLLDGGGDRISASIYQTGDYIFTSHAYGDAFFPNPISHNSVSWAIFDARTNANVTEGTITDPDIDFSHVSIAPSRFGTKFLIAYTGSGPNQILSAFANICSFNKALGTSSCGERILIKEGLDPGYILTFNGDRNRWGDYSAVQWDQSSNSWWLFQEYPGLRNALSPFYSPNSGRWNTVITQIGLGAVPEPGAIALFGLGVGGLMLRRRRRAG